MLELRAQAVPECLERVHALLDGLWAEAGEVEAGARHRFATAVAELVANVVEHGRTPGGDAPQLELRLHAPPGRLEADLVDDGVEVPGATDEREPVDELAEDGRGLLLVRAALDELRYEHRDGHNRWWLLLRR